MPTFTVRPSNTEKEAFRIRLTPAALLGLKLKPGDLCDILTTNGTRQAVAWDAQNIKDGIVQTSRLLQELYGIKLGDKVEISRSTEHLQTAETVTLIQRDEVKTLEEGSSFWEVHARLNLHLRHDVLGTGQIVRLENGLLGYDFEVRFTGINTSIAKITPETLFVIPKFGSDTKKGQQTVMPGLHLDRVAGFEAQTRMIESKIACLQEPSKAYWPEDGPVEGVIVYGTTGTGKTRFIESVAQAEWPKVIRWTPRANVACKDISLVIVDLQEYSKHVTEVKALFDALRSKTTPSLVLGEVRHPNDVAAVLRSSEYFETELELPVPQMPQRLAILHAITHLGNDHLDLLHDLAQRTHGYVAADLKKVAKECLQHAFLRRKALHPELQNGTNGISGEELAPSTTLFDELDIEAALSKIRPSALQEIFLERPTVKWSDIGGQHETKRQLIQAVERPLKQVDAMREMGMRPKKGILLYGPPGCSKTLLVKALASETSVNFLAVKGAELISMYVGESERATREVFRKARAASPCIIFFDEIDAIASLRKAGGGELHVLTTLLNEMDGFEELRNVLVVAATNKPQDIDPALMRPGRFDEVIYIGLPDAKTRKEILLQQFRRSRVEDEVSQRVDELVTHTQGYSGAEIVGIYQKAAERALDEDRTSVSVNDLREAVRKAAKGTDERKLEEFRQWNAARLT